MDESEHSIALAIEALALTAVVILGLLTYRHSSKLIRGAERALSRWARQRALAAILVGALSFAASATLSILGHMPEPEVHDEFSYLLAADTFAHGRLANPTHPMWVHFESFHIIHQPTYASKYPPGQGIMLALGQVLAGYPIVGVWLGTAVACAAIYWMLLAWTPAWLALLGGLMTAFHPGILYWSQIYWGGQLGMIGGALVFGALPRLMRSARLRDSLLMGMGLIVLANSRPFEGLLASFPVGVALLLWMAGKPGPRAGVSLERIVLPISVLLTVSAVGMGYYNRQVTGSPLRLPYLVHEQMYDVVPSFIWQSLRVVPAHHHTVMRDFYAGWAKDWYNDTQSAAGLFAVSYGKLQRPWYLFQGIYPLRLVLTIPLLALPWCLGRRWCRLLLISVATFAIGLLTITWAGARLSAPITGALILLYVQGLRYIHILKVSRLRVGRFLVWSITIVAAVTFLKVFVSTVNDKEPRWYLERARLSRQLKEDGRRHLIIVRYGPQHSPLMEWVYNKADIDGAEIVWAREMPPAEDEKLIEYFKERQIWLLDVYDDSQPPRLVEYPRQFR